MLFIMMSLNNKRALRISLVYNSLLVLHREATWRSCLPMLKILLQLQRKEDKSDRWLRSLSEE